MKTNKKIRNFNLVSIILSLILLASCTSDTTVPTITTREVSGITSNSALTGGTIASDGGTTVSSKGVCWSTTEYPRINANKITDISDSTNFISSITGLLPNTVYYVRAFATNSQGTAYGSQMTFTTTLATDSVVPTLTTTAVSSIGATTASAGGNITSDGGAPVTARGICWSTTTGPTVALTTKTSDGTGAGIFTSSITGLTVLTTYYVRAYATNSVGTVYGNEVSFKTASNPIVPTLTTTAASAISSTTANAGGNITSDGGAPVTARGICWSTTTGPTTALATKTSDGTGIGTFTSSITGLTTFTTYYVKAYATNSVGTVYGNEVSFKTTASSVLPTLSTTAASAISVTAATAGGNITSDGGAPVTARGVCWSTTTGPTTSLTTKTSDGTGIGTFTSSITGLTTSTTYYVKAYATNSVGTVYGNEISFTTTASAVLPTLSTTAASAISATAATAGGNITSDGGAGVTVRGICWSTTTGPTTALATKTSNGTGTGAFTSSITGLTAATTYYVRAYATNSTGTAYGNEISFATTAASANTAGILTITTSTATAGGGYNPSNIVAIWIKSSTGTYVKSLMVLAATRKNDLINWIANNSAKNVTDATTGATQNSYATRTCTWNGTNTSGVVVPNGNYILCMELCDGRTQYHEFAFTKGTTAVTLTPANVTSFSNISIKWTPN
jgi:DUF2075 family protein